MKQMQKAGVNPARMVAAMAVLTIALAALPFLKGVLILGKHEGDTLHLADIVMRMAKYGQLPHLDFMTPLGILTAAPIVMFVKAGLGFGMAFAAAQALVAALLFVPVMRVALSRLPGWTGWVYSVFVLASVLALVAGESNSALSLSMHYNRWAWALAFVIVPLAMLEPIGTRRSGFEGAVIGLGFAALVLLKVTYAMAFFPAVLLALILRRDLRAILWALIFGLGALAVVTALLGIGYWMAYLHDLLTVAHSTTRSSPGLPLAGVIAAPAYLAGSLALMAGVIFLRQSGRMTEGLVLLLLAPAFIYVTYQNFGNDPQWLVLVGLILIQLRPEGRESNALGWPLGQAMLVTGVVALALITPSVLNMIWSPLRLYAEDTSGTSRLLPELPQAPDVLAESGRLYRVVTAQPWDGPGQPYESYSDHYSQSDEAKEMGVPADAKPVEINGEALPECTMTTGIDAWFETAAKDLTQQGLAGSHVLVADLFSSIWLFGDFKPLQGGAPWYYSGIPGLSAADYVLVPLCPTQSISRDQMVGAILDAGWTLTPVSHNRLYRLFRPVPPAQ